MSFKSVLWVLVLLALGLAAAGWLTPWLDPYVPQLEGWRQQARKTPAGQYLSPAPEPRWVTIAPGDKAACLKQAGGELNDQFVLCRSGRRELVRENLDGTRTVLEVKATKEEEGMTPSRAR